MKKTKQYVQVASVLAMVFLTSLQVNAQRNIPASYPGSTTVNYVRSWDAKAAEANVTTLKTKGLREMQQTTQYFDGLGRPLQTVVKQGSLPTGGTAKDMVSMVEYDAFGRESVKYLPAAATTSDGLFKLDPFAQQAAFYNTQLAGQSGETNLGSNNLNWAYSQTTFEASPLNRISEVFAPGASWVGTSDQTAEASRRSVKTKYYANTPTDGVRKWQVDIAALGSFSTYSSSGAYPAGELYKTITVDEHGKQVIEFKDKEGKVILKKVQLTAAGDDGTGKNHDNWICTYYLYDDFGNLRCVIQPKGVEAIKGNWNLTNTTILEELCFRYEYDQRNRMIIKQVPGAKPIEMVYDARDRLVMTQDGELKKTNQYLVTKYDGLNRPIETGLLTNTSNPGIHRSAAYDVIDYPITSTGYNYLTKTGYDTYFALPLGTGMNANLDDVQINNSYGFYTTYNTSPEFAQPVTASKQTDGFVTWTETKILGTGNSLYTIHLYDDKGRVIQVKSKNQTGGIDVATTQYSWSGQPLVTLLKQVNNSSPAQTSFVVTRMSYDDLGRLTQVDKKIQHSLVNGNALPTAYTTLLKNEYDALGQLKKKELGKKKDAAGAYTSSPITNMAYEYNIRGWLLNINKSFMESTNADQYFAMELGYDKNGSMGSFVNKQYNGNISGYLWKSEGDKHQRKYDFTYDAANRLKIADFNQRISGSGASANFTKDDRIDFSSNNIQYDLNGNLTRLGHNGIQINIIPPIDNLTYTYADNSNKLLKVTDASTFAANGKLGDFKDGTNGTADDYGYDDNGNLKLDENKVISDISYNHLNLPQTVTITGKGSITYTYDAAGSKLKKVTTELPSTANGNKTITSTTTYLGGLVYESKTISPADPNRPDYADKLQLVGHEEGRIRPLYDNPSTPNTPTGFAYDYFMKDHLGNVRMVLTEEQKQDIYPAATLEGDINTTGSPNAINVEKNYYTIDPAYVVANSMATGITSSPNTAYPNKNGGPGLTDAPVNPNPSSVSTANSEKLYRVDGRATGNKMGLGILLKVMAGDKISIMGKSYYFESFTGGTSANSTILAADIIAGILGSPGGAEAATAHGGITEALLNASTNTTGGINNLITKQNNNANSAPSAPKAYINYIFFDVQFRGQSNGFSKVGNNGAVWPHADLNNLTAAENGYVYIYVSNQSPIDVFFDNLQVMHTRSPILEETHYYPFGLTMAGISSKALAFGNPENKYKYNGKEEQRKEFSDGSGLEWTALDFRNYDMQIGRFHSPDALADLAPMQTPYRFAFNNPIFWSDPTGLYEYDKDGNIVSNGTQKGEIDFIKNYVQENGTEGLMSALQNAGFALDLEEVVVTSGSKNANSEGQENNFDDAIKWSLWGVNTTVGAASAYTVYKGAYLTSNELWHKTQGGKTYYKWSKLKNNSKAFNNNFIKKSQAIQANKVSDVRKLGGKLTKAGGVLLVADIALSGELKPSHAINAAMLAASTTGVGSIVAGVWFLADFGTMGVNYLLGNGAKGIGDMIDESVGTYEMYDGVY